MTNESKQSPTSGSKGSASTQKSAEKPSAGAGNGIVRLKSLSVEGGDNPGNGIFIPKAGQIFEANAEQGRALIACGLAELVKE